MVVGEFKEEKRKVQILGRSEEKKDLVSPRAQGIRGMIGESYCWKIFELKGLRGREEKISEKRGRGIACSCVQKLPKSTPREDLGRTARRVLQWSK